ncbi:MAG: MBOAT family protein [Gemmataceae bacterium]
MSFASLTFIGFLAVVLLIYHLLRRREHKYTFLLLASWFFYASWSPPLLALLLFITGLNFYAGARIEQSTSPRARKAWLWTAIVIDLCLLSFFKYAGFLVQNSLSVAHWLGWSMSDFTVSIVLPLGISFYTFQAISYTVDVYRGDIKAVGSFRDFALFLSFFPQLIAGPIVRASEFLPQLETPPRVTAQHVVDGLHWIVLGFFKKVFLADQLAIFVDMVFADPGSFDAATLRWAIVAYAAQIYCDFSGYSDIAIGCGKWLGFELPINFRFPYLSASITEFWQRWHITLGSWLRDYLYIPLGGSRRGQFRTYFNLMLTFLLCGFWHGASWTYAIWGAYNGLMLCVHRVFRLSVDGIGWLDRVRASFAYRLGAIFVTFLFYGVGLVCVRSMSWPDAWLVGRTWLGFEAGLTGRFFLPYWVPMLLLLVLAGHLFSGLRAEGCRLLGMPPLVRAACYTVAIVLLVVFAPTKNVPFIYFQF